MQKFNIDLTGLTVLVNVLQTILIVLRATNQIDWNWLIVLIPILSEIAITIIVLVLILIWLRKEEKDERHIK